MDELQISGKRFISSQRIAKENRYTADYIGQLIRGGKVAGQKVGRAWYVDAASFDAFLGREGQVQQVQQVQPEQPVQKEEAKEEKKEIEPVLVVQEKEAPAYVPLHLPVKEEPAEIKKETGGLRYYADETPSLPEIRTYKSESRIAAPAEDTGGEAESVFVPECAPRARKAPLITLAAIGIVVFIFSAVMSSAPSLNISIEAGNAAAVSYGFDF